jgi:threonylcarbamoyladenosine tRNA methylthiotransferase MtaB
MTKDRLGTISEDVGQSVRPRAAFTTLGCKLNQFETEQMRQQLEEAGFVTVAWGEGADVYVVNSCTVTGRADRDARRLVRSARHANPEAVVVLAGCYADASPEARAALPEADLIVPNSEKAHLAERLAERGVSALSVEAGTGACYGGTGPMVRRFAGHTRAFVKVQEGCDAHCAYCLIPKARGRAKSVPLEDVERQARALGDAGHPELVLIGTHLGRYGVDLEPRATLAELVERLLAIDVVKRLRLSSIEPIEISEALLDLVARGAGGRICRHLHVPLQSGCDSVLQRMRRPYLAEEYRAIVGRCLERVPGLAVGADVIVGFPGETEDDFAETVAFVEGLPLAYLHVFTYSPRPGTDAAEMPDQVKPADRKRRNLVLREIGARKAEAFAAAQVGHELVVVIEEKLHDGRRIGVSDNYLKVTLPAGDGTLHGLVRVRVTGSEAGGLEGIVCE